MSQVFIQNLDQAAKCHCDNCEWASTGADTAIITDIEQRLDPGSIVPAGECPDCGALAYLDDDDENTDPIDTTAMQGFPRRVTEKFCKDYCTLANDLLAQHGVDTRFSFSPRNGYCAVDLYSQAVRDSGGTWVERMLVGGSPRECCIDVKDAFYDAVSTL